MRRKLKVLLVALSGWMLQLGNVYAQNVNVDLNTTHQVIRGFGGIHINSWQGTQLSEDMQEKAFDNDPGEIGLSIFRMRIDPNSDNWEAELPIAQYAKSKGAIVFASPWNPPSHMRQLLRETEHGTDYVLLPEYYDEYVDHLNSFIAFMESNGVPLYAISVQNEPDWHSWTAWTPQQMLKFVRENAGNINGRVIAPESLGYVRSMTDPLLNDPVANANIDILGTHLYGTPKENIYYPLAYEKNKEIWMTEHLYGSDKPEDNTWNLALKLADEINTTMDANMSAFVYWYIRRFYGLIDETGNITDKGYVMSQFSKFITPGAKRVAVDNFHASENVNVTAYKNDTSFVMVVVNNGFNKANLTINLQGAGFDKVTKFTTSATKKVVNEGETIVSGGSFSVSVDAKSITTFTTHPEQGGKQENQPPVASAGTNLLFTDSEGLGEVTVVLKGSESHDPDGDIINYSWARDGQQIAWQADPELKLGIGEHTFVLTVTDNDGARASSNITVSVTSLMNANVWLEAECTEVGSNWDSPKDPDVSSDKYLMAKPGVVASNEPSGNNADHLVYDFYVPENGNFKIWGRVLAPSADDDSFWVRVDEGDWVNWNGIQGGSSWQWDDVHNSSNENPMIYPLDSGNHTLTVSFREDGAGIDKFYITNTGQKPSALGNEASNCETLTNISSDGTENIKVYPNPVKSRLFVETPAPFSSLNIYDIKGKKVKEIDFPQGTAAAELPINLGRGIYLLQILTDKEPVMKRFVVEY